MQDFPKAHETSSHYAIDTQFFESFLDSYLKYSSGWYAEENESLEVATRRMLDRIIGEAGLCVGASLLEVGFGWGSLLRRIQETRPDVSYYGVAPSLEQHAFCRQRFLEVAELFVSTFEEFKSPLTFDAVAFVGSFCHLKDKVAQLERARSLIRPGGHIVIEDTFFLSQRMFERHARLPQTQFLQEEVFGFAHITAISCFMDQVRESGLKVVSLQENTASYRKTIDAWLERLQHHTLHPEKEKFVRYLQIAQAGWDYTIGNFLITLTTAPRHRGRKRAGIA